jgi:hypothetical protein
MNLKHIRFFLMLNMVSVPAKPFEARNSTLAGLLKPVAVGVTH